MGGAGVIIVLLICLVILSVALVLLAHGYVRLCDRLEALTGQAEDAAEGPERPKPDEMDEGFENIMRFQVNGKTGFE